jgi:hypothetical protein
MAARIDTPQTRTRITRLVRNVWPEYNVQFVEGLERGIGFRIVDAKGVARTHVVRVYRVSQDLFTRTWLRRAIVNAKGPEPGFPRLEID